MDVRCENCQTVYEFDEARIKETGVTVKCTQCGHIFKVRKREAGQRRTLPGLTPVHDGPPPSPRPGSPVGSSEHFASPPLPIASPLAKAPASTEFGSDSLPPGSEARVWMLRGAADGEIRRFRELTTLQQWIVEKKAFREDEISRTGDRWKKLSGIAELSPFFRIVEQAEASARAAAAAEQRSPRSAVSAPPSPNLPAAMPARGVPLAIDDQSSGPMFASAPSASAAMPAHGRAAMGPAVGTGQGAGAPRVVAPMTGPDSMGDLLHRPVDDSAFGPPPDDEDASVPRRSFRGAIGFGIAALLLVLGVGGYLAVFRRPALRSLVASDEGSRGQEAYRKGREYFLLDTDDDFRHADQQLQRAQGADESNPLPVAALASMNATWARYIREDARALVPIQPSRAEELRRQAQARVDDAKRYANEARSLAPEDPDVNLALADFLISDGAPAAQVEESLRRAEARRAEDPVASYLRGMLLLRDGKSDEARAQLEHANQLNQKVTQHDLLRADYSLATLAMTSGRREEARAAAQRILDTNNHHERARALLSVIEAAPRVTLTVTPAVADGGAAHPAAAVAPSAIAPVAEANAQPGAPTAPPGAPAASPAGAPSAAPAPNAAAPAATGAPTAAPAEPHGYSALVSIGNRQLERGKGKEAIKSFEKALAEQPDGIDALIGLAYANLDTEHYNAAIDKFKQVLSAVPANGEAIIGIAETYKARGDKVHALEFYRRYLTEQPGGSKASMARTNVQEFETETSHTARPATATEIKEEPAPGP